MKNMKIISNVKARPNSSVCEIVFADGASIELHMDLVLKYRLGKNTAVDEKLWEDVINDSDTMLAKQTAYNYASYAPRTEFQIIKKLKDKGFNEDKVLGAIEFLKQFNLVDDYIYCQKYIKDYLRRKKSGADRITIELLKKGIPKHIAKAAVEDFFPKDDEFEIVLAAANKKMRSLTNKPPQKRKNSLIAYLQRQGFQWQIIKQALEELGEVLSDEDEHYDDFID